MLVTLISASWARLDRTSEHVPGQAATVRPSPEHPSFVARGPFCRYKMKTQPDVWWFRIRLSQQTAERLFLWIGYVVSSLNSCYDNTLQILDRVIFLFFKALCKPHLQTGLFLPCDNVSATVSSPISQTNLPRTRARSSLYGLDQIIHCELSEAEALHPLCQLKLSFRPHLQYRRCGTLLWHSWAEIAS